MTDALDTIRDRLAKAQAKASRAQKTLEAAKAEVHDLQTALRVMTDILGEGAAASAPNPVNRQVLIARLLPTGEAGAKSPADVFEEYRKVSDEEIASDTFRTTLWRLKDLPVTDGADIWVIKGEHGRYWKLPASWNTRQKYSDIVDTSAWVSSSDDDEGDI